jgi:hypothetical protein
VPSAVGGPAGGGALVLGDVGVLPEPDGGGLPGSVDAGPGGGGGGAGDIVSTSALVVANCVSTASTHQNRQPIWSCQISWSVDVIAVAGWLDEAEGSGTTKMVVSDWAACWLCQVPTQKIRHPTCICQMPCST